MYPVDFIAKDIMDIASTPENLGKCYHFVNPHSFTVNQIGQLLQDAHYNLRKIPCAEWRSIITNAPSSAPWYVLGPYFTEGGYFGSHPEVFKGDNVTLRVPHRAATLKHLSEAIKLQIQFLCKTRG
jgi:hypothetical protein